MSVAQDPIAASTQDMMPVWVYVYVRCVCAGDPQTETGATCSLQIKKRASETYNKLCIRGEGETR
jgi:hypothetical protein